MPNWCDNTLTIEGNQQDLFDFWLAVRSDKEHLSFSSLYPVPSILDSEAAYYWKIENWGTKWDVDNVGFSINADGATFLFATAWSPPTPWVIYVSNIFPNLSFILSFNEPGMGFKGTAEVKNGNSIENEEQMTTEDYHEVGLHDDNPDPNCEFCAEEEDDD